MPIEILSILWGLVVALSFVSLGRIIARIVRTRIRPDFFLAAGWGMAGMTVLGGWLNLVAIAKSPVLIAFVLSVILVDLFSAYYRYASEKSRGSEEMPNVISDSAHQASGRNRGDRVWIVILLLFVAAKYLSGLVVYGNRNDDQPAYTYQTVRMVKTGSIGVNPFSDRQLISLNGQQFLLGLLLSVAPVKHAYLLDPGICWIFIGGFAWSLLKRDLRAPTRLSCVLTMLVLMADAPRSMNLGGSFSGTVLILTLIRTACLGSREDGTFDRGTLLLLGLTAAGACAVKTSFFVFSVLFIGCWFLIRMVHSPRVRDVQNLFVIGAAGTAFVVPWMWQQYLSSGTCFYPFLGLGTHLSPPELNLFGDPPAAKLRAAIGFLFGSQITFSMIALFLLARNPIQGDLTRWHIWLAALASAIMVSSLMMYQLGVGWGQCTRYIHPILYATLIPVGLWGCFGANNSTRGLIICLAFFLGSGWQNVFKDVARVAMLIAGKEQEVSYDVTEQDKKQVEDAQASIPKGGRILASFRNVALLDFSRNKIWNMDQPGMAGPPPGFPLPAELSSLKAYIDERIDDPPAPYQSDDLYRYLQGVGVDYLIYDSGPDWFMNEAHLKRDDNLRWNRVVVTISYLIYLQIAELKGKCPILYDDGRLVVLDLRAKSRPD